jgi:hypothetical protein
VSAPSTPAPSRLLALIAFGASVFAIALGAVVGATVLRGHREVPGLTMETQATHACEAFVRDRLRVPLTAVFSTVVTTPAGDAWAVVGAVEAQSGGGTLLRDYFACRTHSDRHGHWSDDGTRLG